MRWIAVGARVRGSAILGATLFVLAVPRPAVAAPMWSDRFGIDPRGIGDASLPWPASATASSRRPSNDGLLSVVCPSARGCTALGYHDGVKQSVGIFAGAGSWDRHTALLLPANGSRFGAAFFAPRFQDSGWESGRFNAMSCPSIGNCTVVGGLLNNQSYYDGVLLTETDGRWGRSVEEPLPADALRLRPRWPMPDNEPTAVSCASAGNCTAIGYYTSFGSIVERRQGLLLTETNGSWGRGVRAPLPSDAYRGNVYLNSVSCSTAGNCTAVGSYDTSGEDHPGVLLTQTNGEWEPAVRAPLPARIGPRNGSVNLQAVSCSSPGNCTAVGTYRRGAHTAAAVLLTETDGTWATGIPAPLPANSATRQVTLATRVYLNSVSCSAPGDCTAVGDYVARGGHQEGLLLTQADGSWTVAQALLPAGAWRASLGPGVTLKSVSCASAGNCTAVGSYFKGRGGRDAVSLLLTQIDGRWAKGVAARLPAGAAHLAAFEASGPDYAQAGLASVSCASAGNCTAVGQHPHNTSGDYWGLRVTQSNGKWGRGVWVRW
jgi:hypothetical protein